MRDLMRIAQIQPAENLAHEIPRASRASSSPTPTIGDVRGLEGFYHYRQYNAVELAEKRTLEDVWHLMFEGELPTLRRARRVQRTTSRRCATIPAEVKRAAAAEVAAARPRRAAARHAAHDGLAARRATSASGRRSTSTHAELRRQALQVCAVVPTLLTALYRLQHGLEPIDPTPSSRTPPTTST